MAETTKNPEEMTREEIAAAMGGAPTPEPEVKEPPKPEEPAPITPPAEEGVSYTAADGTIYKAKTQEELWNKVTSALNHTKEAVRDRERQIYELKPKPEEKPEEFSNQKYLELMGENSIKALEYIESFRPEVKELRETVTKTKQQSEINSAVGSFYRSHPDYAKVRTTELDALIEKQMLEKGRGISADNLSLSYLELKVSGKIPDAPVPATKKQAPPETPQGGSTGRRTRQPDYESMTREQLKAEYEKQARAARQQVN